MQPSLFSSQPERLMSSRNGINQDGEGTATAESCRARVRCSLSHFQFDEALKWRKIAAHRGSVRDPCKPLSLSSLTVHLQTSSS